MPVSLPPIPHEIRDAFLGGLGDFLASNQDLLQFIRGKPDQIFAIPIYRIEPERLRSGARTEAATPVAWRVLASSGAEGIAADVARSPSLGRFVITSAHVSTKVPDLFDFLQFVLHQTAQPGQEFELRLLRMKSAYLEVAWLKSNTGEPDLFIPVISGVAALARRERYTADRLFSEARAVAERTTGFRRP